jgi:very-short-patch-repair endonuclease
MRRERPTLPNVLHNRVDVRWPFTPRCGTRISQCPAASVQTPRVATHPRCMQSIAWDVTDVGGVAATRELLARGHTEARIWRAAREGDITRVRKGWYAIPSLHQDILAALRVGGRLACVSAAKLSGLWIPDEPALHVAVPETASRLRTPSNHRQRLAAHPDAGVVVHWSDSQRGSRLVVSPSESCAQAFACISQSDAFVVLESALRHRLVSMGSLPTLVGRLARDDQRVAACASDSSDSGTESMVKLALLRARIPFRQQVRIPGVGRVDFLVGSRLVIEVDSLAFHPDPHADRHRDGELGLRGYRVLRFMYWHVRRDLAWVERVVHAAYLRGDHLAG